MFAGRWNHIGQRVIYTADSLAHAIEETLVHSESGRILARNLLVMRIEPLEKATDLQGAAAPGDSGGPAFIEVDGKTYLAGIGFGTDDTNGDGKVSLEEYKAAQAQGWMFIAMGADKIKVADVDPMFRGAFAGVPVDAQGYVTEAAWNGSAESRFKAADKNGDGFLSAEELMASMGPPQ